MKKLYLTLALASLLPLLKSSAISLDDIQLWAGSGTNRAALVIEWSAPESLTNSSVPIPLADKALVWGYRFNGTNATGIQMLNAIVVCDPRLYAIEATNDSIEAVGYNLKGDGIIGVTDGNSTNWITNGILAQATLDLDAARALDNGDLYWGGVSGPKWELWTELGDNGGFFASPVRGTSPYWTPANTTNYSAGVHGQWQYTTNRLNSLRLFNGSWIGLSVAAGEFETNPAAPYNLDKHAPITPDGTYVAYICDTNDFATAIISTNNIDPSSPYNNPAAVLNRPTLTFIDRYGGGTIDRTKIVEPPYWTDPSGNDVITEISSSGQITVKLGRKVYDDPDNPYGVDLIVYGNSFYIGSGIVGDESDLNSYSFTSGIYGHPTTVSVSQDGTNWFAYPTVSYLFPDNAYRWDDTNATWTDEEMNPTKPLNPLIYTNNFNGQSVAAGLDQFIEASGGTGYDLKGSGLPWIQYVQLQPGPDTYTVIDAIAAVDPPVVGDALSIAPDNLASGITNLAFQKPADCRQNLISINFNSVSANAKISTVILNDFSPFAPVAGSVSSAYQIQLRPVVGTNAVTFQAGLCLRVSPNYTGNGGDLRVYQWHCTNWAPKPFTFNPEDNEVQVAGVTDFSAFVISQIVPPQLSIQAVTNGFAFQFVPVANCANILERSADLVNWIPIATNTPGSAQPITLRDTNAPADQVFYRMLLNVP